MPARRISVSCSPNSTWSETSSRRCARRGVDQQPAQITAVLGILTAHPHSTAASVALMHALRDGGFVGSPKLPHNSAESTIPNTIVQFWDTAEVPDDVRELMLSWPAMNPSFRHIVFNDASASRFIAQTYGLDAARAYARGSGPAQKADVFRLAYLSAFGGIYADSDDRCHADLKTILPQTATLVLYQEDFGSLGNNFIAVAPGHPVIVCAFRLAIEALGRGDGETVWLSTGPALITRAVAQYLVLAGDTWPQVFETMILLDRLALYSAIAIHCVTGYKVTEKHWSNSVRRKTDRAAALVETTVGEAV